jgi:hypothetical protein
MFAFRFDLQLFATTTGALAQNAINIVVPIQQNIQNGVYEDPYAYMMDLCAAILALAEAYYATLNAAATPSLSTAVATTVTIGNQYSLAQSVTSAVYTRIR